MFTEDSTKLFNLNTKTKKACKTSIARLHLRGVYMTPGRLSSRRESSLRFPVHSGGSVPLCIGLHDTGMSHTGASSPRLLYRGENFIPVRKLATVSCKRRTTTRLGMKSVSL